MRYCELRERARGTLTNFEWVKALSPAASATTHRDPLGESRVTPTPAVLSSVIVRRGKRPGPLGRVHPSASSSVCLRPRRCSAAERMLSTQTPRLMRIDQSRGVYKTRRIILWEFYEKILNHSWKKKKGFYIFYYSFRFIQKHNCSLKSGLVKNMF